MLPITITSDFICPWCHIGAVRLEAAIERAALEVEVRIDWAPFELNPNMPVEGMSRKAYRSKKFGSWAHSEALDAQTLDASRDDAVSFDYASIDWTPSTFLAHRVTAYAATQGLQHTVATRLLKAYFESGQNIGDPAVVDRIAIDCGLDRAALADWLEDDEGRGLLRADIDRARLRIRGVPHFEIGGLTVEGAQPVDVLDEVLQRARG